MTVELATGCSAAVQARLRSLDGRTVAWFRLEGGKHRGALGPSEADALQRIVDLAGRNRLPLVGVLATSGADITEGVASLAAWGRLARSMAGVGGVVPILLTVAGPCVSGPALLLGLADQVVMTEDTFAYLSGPEAVAEFTGVSTTRERLGGAAVHAGATGVASLVVADEPAAEEAITALLGYLPDHHLADPPREACADPVGRPCRQAAMTVPAAPNASYDVRLVVADILDANSFLELRGPWASNLVTGYGRLAGRPVGVVANQPSKRAGTLDIETSRKAARFVTHCDAFNLPILTFVDTPGFEPGRDLEHRGMIRHGAELIHAYAAATVPRLCLILRKSYGGAYIVMDSRRIGNDACFAWPGAEVAVMGASGAVSVLFGRRLSAITDPAEGAALRADLEEDYRRRYCSAETAAARGLVDDIIDPQESRRILAGALEIASAKAESAVWAKHSNTPL